MRRFYSPNAKSLYGQVFLSYASVFLAVSTFALVSRSLNPSNFGQLQYLISLFALCFGPLNAGLTSFINHKLSNKISITEAKSWFFHHALPSTLFVSTTSFLILILALCMLALPHHLKLVLVGLCINEYLNSYSMIESYYFKTNLGLKVSLASALQRVAYFSSVLLLYSSGRISMLTVISSMCISNILKVSYLYSPKSIKTIPSRSQLQSLLAIPFHQLSGSAMRIYPYVLSSAAIAIYMKIDIVMMPFLGVSYPDVSAYSIASTFLSVLLLIQSIFVRNYKFKWKNTSALYYRWNLFTIGSILLTALSSVSVFLLVPFLYGSTYPAVPTCFVILSLCFPFLFVSTPINIMQENQGMISYQLRKRLIGALLNILLNAAIVPILGIIGAAIATFISFSYTSAIHVLFDKAWRAKMIRLMLLADLSSSFRSGNS